MTELRFHEKLRMPGYEIAAKSGMSQSQFWKAQQGLAALKPEQEARYRQAIEQELARLVRVAAEFNSSQKVSA